MRRTFWSELEALAAGSVDRRCDGCGDWCGRVRQFPTSKRARRTSNARAGFVACIPPRDPSEAIAFGSIDFLRCSTASASATETKANETHLLERRFLASVNEVLLLGHTLPNLGAADDPRDADEEWLGIGVRAEAMERSWSAALVDDVSEGERRAHRDLRRNRQLRPRREEKERTLAPIDLSMSTKIIPASSPSSVLTSTNATTPWSTLLFGFALTSPSAIAAIIAVELEVATMLDLLGGRMWLCPPDGDAVGPEMLARGFAAGASVRGTSYSSWYAPAVPIVRRLSTLAARLPDARESAGEDEPPTEARGIASLLSIDCSFASRSAVSSDIPLLFASPIELSPASVSIDTSGSAGAWASRGIPLRQFDIAGPAYLD